MHMRGLLNPGGDGMPVLVRPVKADPGPVREVKDYYDFSEIGQKAWDRAIEELDRRIQINPLQIDEIIAMLGDIRLAKDGAKYLEKIESDKLYGANTQAILAEIHTKFAKHYQATKAFEASLAPQAAVVQGPAPSAPAPAAAAPAVPLVFGAPPVAAEPVPAPAAPAPRTAEEILTMGMAAVAIASQAMKWHEYVAEHGGAMDKLANSDGTPKAEEDITAMDLFSVDIGPWYQSFIANTPPEDRDDMVIFVNFVMKTLADLQAESFNERQISVANDIMTAKRTRMHSDLLAWLAVLRMNRKWIEQRKKDFGHLLPLLDVGELEAMSVMSE